MADQGDTTGALRVALDVIAADPSHVAARINCGILLARLGRSDEAVAMLEDALAREPERAASHFTLGNILLEQGHTLRACECLSRAAELAPDDVDILNNLGATLLKLGRRERAEQVLRRAHGLAPDHLGVLQTLSDALRLNDRAAEAEAFARAALDIDAGAAGAWCRLGLALADQHRLEESLEALRRAVELSPGDTDNALCLATTLLLAGRLDDGWRHYECRTALPAWSRSEPALPRWDGTPMPGGTLLLWGEQGMGDVVQFARFARRLKGMVGKVIVRAPAAATTLLRGIEGFDEVVSTDVPADCQASLHSLPFLLGIADDVASAPYLVAPAERAMAWRQRLDRVAGRKIGLCWAGNAQHQLDHRRSLPADLITLLPQVPGLTYVNLQVGPRGGEFGRLRGSTLDFADELGDFAETAALVSALDLVVTVDTAIAHLAGALGVPVLLLLPFSPDWRWLLGRDDSPLYASLRLFRQAHPGQWQDPLLRIGALLADAPAGDMAALLRDNRLEEAEAAIWGALAAGQAVAPLAKLLGAIRLRRDDAAAAVKFLSLGLTAAPQDAEASNNLAVALRKDGRLKEAAAIYRRTIALAPGFAPAHFNLANLLSHLGRYSEALPLYRKAVALGSTSEDVLYNLGNCLRDLGLIHEARHTYRTILDQRPDHASVRNSLAMLDLLAGNFADGWDGYEWRWRCPEAVLPALAKPLWDGSPLAGRTLLVHAEQGLGDTLQFARYATLAAARGGRVVLVVQPPLAGLCRSMTGIEVLPQGVELPEYDCHTPLLSLPRLLGTRLDGIPTGVPYLTPDSQRVEIWRERLAGRTGLKVGLVWAGNPRHKKDHLRSIRLATLAEALTGTGVALVSLQMGEARAEMSGSGLDCLDLGPELTDFAETAALVAALDLVITVDTSVAHLAGALAVPVWVMLPLAPDWRWLLGRDDSPWYPTMRLYRQTGEDGWAPVVARIGADLKNAASQRADEEFAAALALHNDGRLDEATAAYRALLDHCPDHAATLHHLGLVALAQGRHDEAEALIRAALAVDETMAGAWSNLGIVLRGLGRTAEAVSCYRRAIELAPRHGDAHYNLGNALKALGDRAGAAEHFRHAVELRPDQAKGWNNLGLSLRDLGRLPDAEDALSRALALAPGDTAIRGNLALVLYSRRRDDDVIALCRSGPDTALLCRMRGLAALRLGRLDEAEPALRRAAELDPNSWEAANDLAALLCRRGDPAAARAVLAPVLAAADHNHASGAAAHTGMAVVCLQAGDRDAALHHLERALALDPDHAPAHWNLATLLLVTGDLPRGWREMEWRWRTPDFPSPPRHFAQPQWDGAPLDGRTILVHAEQGLGDTLHMARYLPLVAAKGGRVVAEVQPPLMALMETIPGVAALVPWGGPLPEFDLHIPMLSLPLAFGTDLDTIPADIPYLRADPKRATAWRTRLADDDGLKVGLVWAGSTSHGNDHNRSTTLEALEPLAEIPGVSFLSLQKGRDVMPSGRLRPRDLGPELADFADTAALVEALDLVITVDTSVAHLAGALGKPVWVMLPNAPDWRWLLGRDDTPWYPSIRLYRQDGGGWAPVIRRIRADLAALAFPKRPARDIPLPKRMTRAIEQ